ncbi:MAG: hypothetical protein AAFX52_11040 [Pseudomonadota bacterium]
MTEDELSIYRAEPALDGRHELLLSGGSVILQFRGERYLLIVREDGIELNSGERLKIAPVAGNSIMFV